MIEGEAFSTSFDDSSSSGLSESECGNCHFWYIKKSIVISHSSNNDGDFVSITIVNLRFTYDPFKCLASLEIDIGGLLTLEETSLLKMVVLNMQSGILLERNLKSYIKKNRV